MTEDFIMTKVRIDVAEDIVASFRGYEDSAGLDFIKSDTDEECDLMIGDIRSALQDIKRSNVP